MKSRTWIWTIVVSLFAALVIPVWTAAQSNSPNHKHHQYKLIDIGTFGGPASYASSTFVGLGTGYLNNYGTLAGYADTSIPDPFAPNCANPDCFVSRAFRWDDGVLIELPGLADGYTSQTGGINARGWIAGGSQNGLIDPLNGLPEGNAVLWKDDEIINLGAFEGRNASLAIEVNNRGQVVGFGANTIADPFFGTQLRVFLWENGVFQDVGTLGGPDSPPFGNTVLNERGQVSGCSFTSSIPNQNTGIPTADPFLWEKGKGMTDLGTLGGTVGYPFDLNSRGQVVGTSNLAGDLNTHPFLWTKAGGMHDLGTFGGSNGEAVWVSDAGDVVGEADLPVSGHDAFLWRDGVLTDLGNLGVTSFAHVINANGQIVGSSRVGAVGDARAFLWEDGGPMIDLNTLIPANSSLTLVTADTLNERGEIGGTGVPAGCQPADRGTCGHAFLLIPCDEKHPGECEDYSLIDVADTASAPQYRAAIQQGSESPAATVNQVRNLLRRRYHVPGQPIAPRD